MSHLYCLDKNAVVRLCKAVPSDSELLIYVADWLTHLNMFSDAQVYAILNFVKPEIEAFDKALSEHKHCGILTLAVTDSRWVSLTSKQEFFDATTSEIQKELDEFAVTHVMCDLAALRKRMLHRQELFNGQPQQS